MNTKIAKLNCCLFLFAVIGDNVITAKKHDCKVPKHYEEIGCVAIYDDTKGNGCPSKFKCPDFRSFASNKCHVKGQLFDVGDDIPNDLIPMCRADCQCSSNMRIECANIECPEDDYNYDDPPQTINRYNDLKECCSAIQTPINKADHLSKCQVEGRSYHDGERIYPDGDSCFMCLCAPNFNNKTSFAENSNCVKINCGVEHDLYRINAGCVPIYYRTPTCCPIDMKCPSQDDAIAEGDTSNVEDEDLTCTFGDLTLKLGQKLNTVDRCLKCECSIPPFLTCVQQSNC